MEIMDNDIIVYNLLIECDCLIKKIVSHIHEFAHLAITFNDSNDWVNFSNIIYGLRLDSEISLDYREE